MSLQEAADVVKLRDWILTLRVDLQRAGITYELARSSGMMRGFIERLREIGLSDPDTLPIHPAGDHSIWPIEVLYSGNWQWMRTLAACECYPHFDFSIALNGTSGRSLRALGRVSEVGFERWKYVLPSIDKAGNPKPGFIQPSANWHIVVIPWECSNREIARQFAAKLPEIRPYNRPEPRRPGRRGRSEKAGGRDILNQLTAYRLEKLGVGFIGARKLGFSVYGSTSAKGWKRAVDQTTERLREIFEKKLFGTK
jgi:hypothetical protein